MALSEDKLAVDDRIGRCLDRNTLVGAIPIRLHQGRSLVQADVCGYEIEGQRIVVKDFKPRPWLIRRWWGRWVLRREWERLERLQGIAGIPRLIGWIDEDAFAMEWLEAYPDLTANQNMMALQEELASNDTVMRYNTRIPGTRSVLRGSSTWTEVLTAPLPTWRVIMVLCRRFPCQKILTARQLLVTLCFERSEEAWER